MARIKGVETPGKFWRITFADRSFPLAIVALSLLVCALLSCARGGGTPISNGPTVDAAGPDASQPSVPTGDASEAAVQQESFCGDGRIDRDRGEECDGQDLGGATCLSLLNEQGALGCTEDCRYDDTMCFLGTEVPDDTGVGGSYGGQ